MCFKVLNRNQSIHIRNEFCYGWHPRVVFDHTCSCSRATVSPIGSRSRRTGGLWSHCACALLLLPIQTFQQSPAILCVVYKTRCRVRRMFCKTAQPSRSCPPHSQQTSCGARTVECVRTVLKGAWQRRGENQKTMHLGLKKEAFNTPKQKL
jgi:hypothetical protein